MILHPSPSLVGWSQSSDEEGTFLYTKFNKKESLVFHNINIVSAFVTALDVMGFNVTYSKLNLFFKIRFCLDAYCMNKSD